MVRRRGKAAFRLMGIAATVAGLVLPAGAEPLAPPAATSAVAQGVTDGLAARRQELGGVESDLSATEAERRRIVDDIEAIRTDRVRLSAALIDTTGHVQEIETKVATAEARLSTMTGSQDAITQSLQARRGVLAEVLASLQRMGRKPPPAILVSPEDILKTIRTAMLLGAVLPDLRGQAEALASDLADLIHVANTKGGKL